MTGSAGPPLIINTDPSLNTAILKVGATLASCAVAGSYTWPGGPVSETWAWLVDGFVRPGSYVIAAGDAQIEADVALSATGLPPGIVRHVGPVPVTNTAPVAGQGALTFMVATGSATAPAAMAAPAMIAASATRLTVTPAAAPADGGSAITGYEVRFSADGGTTWGAAVAITGPGAAQTYTGFTSGAANQVSQTRAINAIGPGAWSPSSSAVTMPTPIFVGYAAQTGTGANLVADLTTLVTTTGGSGGPVQPDDVAIAVWGYASVNTDNVMTVNSAGWTKVVDDAQLNASRSANVGAAWKRMGATPDTSVDVAAPGLAAAGAALLVGVFRNVDPTTPFDVAPIITKNATSALANPGAITPTAPGALLWLALVGTGGNSSVTAINPPSGWTVSAQVQSVGSNRSWRMTTSRLAWTSGTVDPPAGTTGTTTSSDTGLALIAALKPY